MRTANFRDDVLWAIAYKLGLDPATDFLKDQAYAIASYINAWVRRLWDAADWPEWTYTNVYSVNAATHYVLWDARPLDPDLPEIPPPEPPTPAPPVPLIGKVLRVYLVDPKTTWTPVETPFRLNSNGIHCGFEHGNFVWIKYLSRAPKFTAREWDADFTYNKDTLVYSPLSGECYLSKSNGNRGHDPTETSESETPNVLTTEITQEFAPANPGLPDTTQIIDVLAAPSPGFLVNSSLGDPPPAGQTFTIEVKDSAGTVLGNAVKNGDGVMSLEDVFADLATQLDLALSGFTVTALTTPVGVRLENLSAFTVSQATFTSGTGVFPLLQQQTQAYTSATAPAPATAKQIRLSINESQVLPGETYTLTFTSLDGAQHPVVYSSLATDGAGQILAGLAAAIVALQGADTFFTGIQSTFDPLSPSLTFTVTPTLAKASLDAVIMPPAALWWTYIPFPLALADQVVRGAYADALKEGGQPDKAGPEEQAVPTEQTIRTAAFASKQYDGLSDQQIPRSRYAKQ